MKIKFLIDGETLTDYSMQCSSHHRHLETKILGQESLGNSSSRIDSVLFWVREAAYCSRSVILPRIYSFQINEI